MKPFRQILLGSFLLTLLSAIAISCSGIGEDDPCDETAIPEIQAMIIVNTHLRAANGDPVAGVRIDATLYKRPCRADPKGHVDLGGITSEDGTVPGFLVIYSLRNQLDVVTVEASVPSLGLSKTVHFGAIEFISGQILEANIWFDRSF